MLTPSDRSRRAYTSWWARHLRKGSANSAATLPQISALKAWLVTLWSEAQLFALIDDQRALITATIEEALWRQLTTELVSVSAAESTKLAALCAEAWMLEHGYSETTTRDSAAPYAPGASGELYRDARARFVRILRLKNAITRAELPNTLSVHAAQLTPLLPRYLLQTPSFAPLPSEQIALDLMASNAIETQVVHIESEFALANDCSRVLVANTREERQHAIAWARKWLNDPARETTPDEQIAIVVPDLRQKRGSWQRTLVDADIPFNLSLGLPISAYPWASSGFVLTNALTQPTSPEQIAQALRHPRWGHSVAQKSAINRRERALMDFGTRDITLIGFLADSVLESMPMVIQLKQWVAQTSGRKTRAQWGKVFAGIIDALTAEEAVLSSEVYQLRSALLESVATWQALDDWLPNPSVSAAHSELVAITDKGAFQPEGSDAPVQVVGLLEAAGTPFAGMWIIGMSERVLPEGTRSNPFLANAWQRANAAGLADPSECDARGRRLLHGWKTNCQVIVASLPETVDDERQLWSPLVLDWQRREASSETRESRDTLRLLMTIDDETATAWQPESSRGTRAAEAQALCPRRGLAEGRLRLRSWPEPVDGLSPKMRGELIHLIAEKIGRALKSGEFLSEDPSKQLHHCVRTSIESIRARSVTLPDYVWNCEHARLHRLFLALINKDAARPEFSVLDVEQSAKAKIGPLTFSMRIDRVDRIEPTEQGALDLHANEKIVVIDYKSGSAINLKGLSDERLTSPQLPLYARALGIEKIDAVAFARVTDDYQDFVGVGTERSGFAPKKSIKKNELTESFDWDKLKLSWSEKLERLARELCEGEAALAPAYGAATCAQCDYQRFCRVDPQLLMSLDESADAEGAA